VSRAAGRPQFSVLGVPVRVEWSFFLIAFLLGYDEVFGFKYMPYWIPIVFVSVLVHEMGHALVAKARGDQPRVLLYAFGGLTFHQGRHSRSGFVAIALAGAVGALVLLGIPSWLLRESEWARPVDQAHFDHYVIATYLVWVNVYWSIANLLPILPLDGGVVMAHLFGQTRARQLTIVFGAGGGLWALTHGFQFAGILGFLFAAQSFGALRTAGAAPARRGVIPNAAADAQRAEERHAHGQRAAAYAAAIAWAQAGQPDRAMAWLWTSVDEGLPIARYLDTEPALEPLRSRADWAALRARAG